MKRPQRRNAPIDMNRVSGWMTLFSGYRHGVTEGRIERWLDQFNSSDRDLAARILDSVDFITNDQIANAFQSALNSLHGWDLDEANRIGKWRFVAYSSSAGESGDSMLHRFRMANGLRGRRYNPLFIRKSELLIEDLGSMDTVVFVDDFSGSGDQVCNSWPEFQELLPQSPNPHLALVTTSTPAIERIQNETDLSLSYSILLDDSDNIFSSRCPHFSRQEKETIHTYCRRVDRRYPLGYGECGYVVVFAHDCPNNSIPILHKSHTRWDGLFRRHA